MLKRKSLRLVAPERQLGRVSFGDRPSVVQVNAAHDGLVSMSARLDLGGGVIW